MANDELSELKEELGNLSRQAGVQRESRCEEALPGNNVAKAVVYPSSYVAQYAPQLAALIRQSMIDVNKVSDIDGQVPLPDAISVSYEGKWAQTFRYSSATEHGNELGIGYQNFCRMNEMADLKSVLDHEFGHGIPGQPDDQKSNELRSDRYADALERIQSLLNEIKAHPKNYDYVSENSTHPNHAERIQALLEEYFGNDVFKMNGSFVAGDYHFKPAGSAKKPMTEDGSVVANWADIKNNMAAPINHAMSQLKTAMNDQGLSHDEINKWLAMVKQQKTVFIAEAANNPTLEPVQSAQLSPEAAKVIADHINDQKSRQTQAAATGEQSH